MSLYSKAKSIFTTPVTVKSIRTKLDGFMNVLTGYNTLRDRANYYKVTADRKLDYNELDSLYRSNSYARKLCIKPAQEMTREDLEFFDTNDEQLFQDKLKNIEISEDMFEGIVFLCIFGGSAIVLNIKDGRNLSEPVDLSNISDIGKSYVLDKSFIYPDGAYNPHSEPDLYYINTGEGTEYIHKDRLIIFDHWELATLQEKIENQGFSDGILQRLNKAIRHVETSNDTVSNQLMDFSQTVYKIDGLNEDLDDDEGEEGLARRIYGMEKSRGSNLRAVIIDGKDHFERQVANLSGLKDAVSIHRDNLTSESDMPHNILHGESPGASLGEAGQAQLIVWYDYIRQKQNDLLYSKYKKIIQYIALALGKPEPKFRFKNLWQMDDKEKAEIQNKEADSLLKMANALKSLWDTQGLSSDEINQMVVEKNDGKYFLQITEQISSLLKKVTS